MALSLLLVVPESVIPGTAVNRSGSWGAALRVGDTLVIYKLDLVARSMTELLVLLEDSSTAAAHFL